MDEEAFFNPFPELWKSLSARVQKALKPFLNEKGFTRSAVEAAINKTKEQLRVWQERTLAPAGKQQKLAEAECNRLRKSLEALIAVKKKVPLYNTLP